LSALSRYVGRLVVVLMVLRLLMVVMMLAMQMRMLCGGTAVSLVLVSAAVLHVWIAPLRAVEAIVPLTVDINEPGTVLGAERH